MSGPSLAQHGCSVRATGWPNDWWLLPPLYGEDTEALGGSMALNKTAQLVRKGASPHAALISLAVGILHPVTLVGEDQTGYTP